MNKNHYSHYFLFFALAVSLIVVYFITKPFLGSLILGAIFAFLFQPIYKKLTTAFKERKNLAAFCTTLIAILLVLLPLSIIGTQIFKESSHLYQLLINGSTSGFITSIENIFGAFKPDFAQYAKQGLEALIHNLGSVFSSFAKILLNVFVFLTAFYFFLKDGDKLKNFLIALSPLKDRDDEFVVTKLKSSVSAVVKGNLAIGLIQGVLTGIGFAIFGVPNAVLLGSLAVFSAFLPGIGTSLVIIPAILFLFFTGNTFGWIGLLIWGVLAVGLIDNILGPRLVGRGMQLHPLAVFISILGGLAFFGPLGFILGPLTVSVCLAFIEIYSSLNTEARV